MVVLPFGMQTHSSPMAVVMNNIWSAALMGLGVIAVKVVNWSHTGDMWEDAPEL